MNLLGYRSDMTHPAHMRLVCLISCLLLLVGCGTGKPPTLKASTAKPIDFSGHWELDFQLSDRFEDKIELEFLLARRSLERQARSETLTTRGGGISVNRASRSLRSIIDIGRFTEQITRSNLLEIIQTSEGIAIQRVDDFPLTCSFYGGVSRSESDGLGMEVCGWDHHQLVFMVILDDGLRVNHRLTLAPEGDKLNIATTVYSRNQSAPFTLNRVFSRFEPLPDSQNCTTTLSRKRVCTRKVTE